MEGNKLKKLRGGYYTPKPIADFISKWAIRNPNDSVLEPSCGNGIFIESLIKRFIKVNSKSINFGENIHAVEYVPKEAAKTIVGDTKPNQASGELSATLAANGKRTASRINNGIKRR